MVCLHLYVFKVATCYFRFTCLQSHNATDMINVAGLRMSELRKFSVCTWQWNCVFWYVYQYLLSNIKQFTLYKIAEIQTTYNRTTDYFW